VHIARGYLGYGLPMAIWCKRQLGLMKAVKRFDPAVVCACVFRCIGSAPRFHEYVLRNWRL